MEAIPLVNTFAFSWISERLKGISQNSLFQQNNPFSYWAKKTTSTKRSAPSRFLPKSYNKWEKCMDQSEYLYIWPAVDGNLIKVSGPIPPQHRRFWKLSSATALVVAKAQLPPCDIRWQSSVLLFMRPRKWHAARG